MSGKDFPERFMAGTVYVSARGRDELKTADAELVVEDDGKKIFLHAWWADEAPDEIFYEATEESVYDVILKHASGDIDFDTMTAEVERIRANTVTDDKRFKKYYNKLKSKMIKELKLKGIDTTNIK